MEKGNSVLFLNVVKAIHDFKRPYKSFKEEESTGSGFIIDISRGLVLTNAKIVENAVSIMGRLLRTGKRDISLELIGICREKDLALCKIRSSDVSLITQGVSNPDVLNLKFADSLKVKPGDSVYSLGYDSSSIQMTNGIVSGFKILGEEGKEDSFSRLPTYIQVNTTLNSGAPLFNSEGKVIGINANKDCVIPSRTFLAIYSELIKFPVVSMPTLGLEWCNTSREIMKKQTGSSATYGIYVRKIYPDSCLDKLEKGDIIRRIDYFDILQDFSLKEDKLEDKLTTVFLDRFGMTTRIGKLKNPNEPDENKLEFDSILTERKMELSEIMDMIPIGTEMILNMNRNQNWYSLKTKYIHKSIRNPSISIDYEIFAGLCVTESNQKKVVICQVFPGTSIYKIQNFKEGYFIKSVIGYTKNFETIPDTEREIRSLDDVRHILRLKPEHIEIVTEDNFVFLSSLSTIIKEDKVLFETFEIKHKYILE